MRLCVNCHFSVGQGDRHAIGKCRTVAKGNRRRKKKNFAADPLQAQRGMPVEGVHKSSASSKKTK